MGVALSVSGEHPTKELWLGIMEHAQTFLIKAKLKEKDITNDAINNRGPRHPPYPDDYTGYQDFVIMPEGLTSDVTAALTIHASWTCVSFRGAHDWDVGARISAGKAFFHPYFNAEQKARVIPIIRLPSRKPGHPRTQPGTSSGVCQEPGTERCKSSQHGMFQSRRKRETKFW